MIISNNSVALSPSYIDTKTKKILCASLIGFLGIFLYSSPVGSLLEEKFGLDWLFKTRGALSSPDNVLIVSIDKLSAEKLSIDLSTKEWPRNISKWPRNLHAQLINDLSQAGARLIIFDVVFNINSDQLENDREFSSAMKKFDNTVLIERVDREEISIVANSPEQQNIRVIEETSSQLVEQFTDAAKAQTSFTVPKVERVKDYWIFRESSGDTPTAPVVLLQILAFPIYDEFIRLMQKVDANAVANLPKTIDSKDLHNVILDTRNLFMRDQQLAAKIQQKLDADSSINHADKQLIKSLLSIYSGEPKRYLNFYGPPRSIQTIPYYHALQENNNASEPPRKSIDFKDKIVFVGFSAATQSEQDIGRDDYHTVFSKPDGLNISGVEIIATAFANLYEDKSIRSLHFSVNWVILFAFGFTVSMIFLVSDRRLSLNGMVFTGTLGISAVAIYLFGAYHIFSKWTIWLPIIIPVLQLILAFVIVQVLSLLDSASKNRQQKDLITALRQAVSPTFPDPAFEEIIGKDKNEQGIYGCCLNTDIEGYTAKAELMPPKELRELIVQYRNVLKEPIRKHQGHIVDMIGDSMLALWVVNPNDLQSRVRACQAALDVALAIEQFNASRPKGVHLPTRFGLHCGELSLSREQGSYSIAGDVVNATNRIQEKNKKFATRILASHEVIDGLEDFVIRPLGECHLRGRVKPVTLFELVGHKKSATDK
ncbi:MAG: CHASE2 domain-containing protein [Nitrosomonas sp.]